MALYALFRNGIHVTLTAKKWSSTYWHDKLRVTVQSHDKAPDTEWFDMIFWLQIKSLRHGTEAVTWILPSLIAIGVNHHPKQWSIFLGTFCFWKPPSLPNHNVLSQRGDWFLEKFGAKAPKLYLSCFSKVWQEVFIHKRYVYHYILKNPCESTSRCWSQVNVYQCTSEYRNPTVFNASCASKSWLLSQRKQRVH